MATYKAFRPHYEEFGKYHKLSLEILDSTGGFERPRRLFRWKRLVKKAVREIVVVSDLKYKMLG